MAQNTAVNIVLQVKDWEALFGIIFNNSDPDIQQLLFNVQTFYSAQVTKPAGNTLVTSASTEVVVLKLAGFLYGNTIQNITQDSGANMFNRVMTALRGLNNIADNYIQTQFATFDANNQTQQNYIRKNGRKYIMILQYDNQ